MRRHSCLNEPTLVSVGSGPLYFHGPPNLLLLPPPAVHALPSGHFSSAGVEAMIFIGTKDVPFPFCFLCSILKPETGVRFRMEAPTGAKTKMFFPYLFEIPPRRLARLERCRNSSSSFSSSIFCVFFPLYFPASRWMAGQYIFGNRRVSAVVFFLSHRFSLDVETAVHRFFRHIQLHRQVLLSTPPAR